MLQYGPLGVRKSTAGDFDFLDTLDQTIDAHHGGRWAGSVPGPQQRFERQWAWYVLDLSIVFRVATFEPIGTVTLYQHDPRSRTAWLAVFGSPDVLGAGDMLLAAGAYLTDMFEQWDLRVVYLDVSDDTLPQFASLLTDAVAEVEVELHEQYLRRDGTYGTQYVIAIHRDGWDDRWGRRIRGATRRRTAFALQEALQ